MDKFKKTDFLCLICKNILNDPIQVPCYCTICQRHLKDASVNPGLIKCETCIEAILEKKMLK